MTFQNLQDRVMSRLNLTSAESRDRIKNFINERYRALATSCGLGQVRFGSVGFNTANGTKTYSPATLIKPLTISYPAESRVLGEKTYDEIRLLDPDDSTTGSPEYFVVQNFNATTCTIRIWPTPTAIYALTAEGILAGVDLTNNADVPAFPEDFHDILIFLASADELMKMEKQDFSTKQETKGEQRAAELRYFIAKSAYLALEQGSMDGWWAGPWGAYWNAFWS